MSENYTYLADVLDDLDLKQMTLLLNDLALGQQRVTRRNINNWRKEHNLPVERETRTIFDMTVSDFLMARG